MNETTNYDVVVYGATMPGIAAVRSLRAVADDRPSVLVVNPRRGIGGVGVGGGQNFWDVREWSVDGGVGFPQGGSFRRWFRTQGQAYDTDRMAETLRAELDLPDVTVRPYHDVTDVATTDDGALSEATVVPLERRNGRTVAGDGVERVAGDVFVDASETGRLARAADVSHTVGREDWGSDDRQMVATLMVLIEDVDWDRIGAATGPDGDPVYGTTVDPVEDKRLFWGGEQAVHAPAVEAFREAYPRFDVKAMNAAEHADGAFWLNALLIYDVDGRFDARRSDAVADGRGRWDRDAAYENAVSAVDSPEFRDALQAFPGLESAAPVRDDGDPKVADLLYLRETIHARDDEGFALERDHVENAGASPGDGGDGELHDSRVGLSYYWLDNNGYTRTGRDVGGVLDPAENPVYLPYEALTVGNRPNLLLPGYAARVSGEAWFQVRVLPNLCVLGDAAGAAAARSLATGTSPADFEDDDLRALRERLREDCDAIVDKRAAVDRAKRISQDD